MGCRQAEAREGHVVLVAVGCAFDLSSSYQQGTIIADESPARRIQNAAHPAAAAQLVRRLYHSDAIVARNAEPGIWVQALDVSSRYVAHQPRPEPLAQTTPSGRYADR